MRTLLFVLALPPLAAHGDVEFGGGAVRAARLACEYRSDPRLPVAAGLPPPKPVDTSPYLIGAIHCPLWGDGTRWGAIVPFADREPALGWYDDCDLGGAASASAAVEAMRGACRKAGFPGLYLLGQSCWGKPGKLAERAALIMEIGMDAGFAYHWPTFTGAFGGELRPGSRRVIEAQENLWSSLPRSNILTLSMGWDSEPWGFSKSLIQWRLKPDEFKTLCQRARSALETRPTGGLSGRLVLLDNWNEFGEGHYIFPTRQHGFGYLDAIRDVFAPNAPFHADLVPGEIGRGPYDSAYRKAEQLQLRNKNP